MKFLIISHVLHKSHQNQIWGYGPYIREMNLWEKHIDSLIVVAPKEVAVPSAIDLAYQSKQIKFVEVPQFNLVGPKNLFKALLKTPGILWKIFSAMRHADHIHLRCPGNMGLLGAMVQVFFSKKKKTAKYAGNWDWNSRQPWSYRLQQRILRNTFLTKNMQVLVYGEWPDRTENIKPFFTASYSEKDKVEVLKPEIRKQINLIFVGSLTANKRPLLALEVLKGMLEKGLNASLVFCGEGVEKEKLVAYSTQYQLDESVQFLGNVDGERVKREFQKAHFLVFGSRSEGWPKVVPEAMWWGCVPVTTAVSCVSQMLGYETRGLLCEPDAQDMVERIQELVNSPEKQAAMIKEGMEWAREFTTERFETEIKQLIRP
ncbi:glycosyltransferase family 4 protein [Cecembia rubra]|uniref:Glycosyltransferase involved in cell wall biosynthesis n=1 Tax=Cecembia rubra TaxID=1485585 RepID=A0A2P8E3B7_9BACT|nr:glycosyltransferase family 4 protein [Cecembia rubra]PSL03959.1 glycosyltransferase involved in cell wall biosynthesis [Cecembia rubra]